MSFNEYKFKLQWSRAHAISKQRTKAHAVLCIAYILSKSLTKHYVIETRKWTTDPDQIDAMKATRGVVQITRPQVRDVQMSFQSDAF